MNKKEIAAFIISLVLTLVILDFIKLPPLAGFITGTILWSVLHFNIKKRL